MGRSRVLLTLLGATLALGSVAWILLAERDLDPRVPSFDSLAVLLFDTSAENAESDQLARGLSFDLLRRLQVLEAFQCSAQAEVSTRYDAEATRFEHARALGAEIVVSGTVQQEADRISLLLVIEDARHRSLIAEIDLAGSAERIFDFQRRIAQTVVDNLGVASRGSQSARFRKDPTRSLKAWDYFLQGQDYLRDSANHRGPVFATDLFRQAVQRDPDFGEAHVGLGEALWITYVRTRNPETILEAELEVRGALSIDPKMSSASVVLAKLLLTDGRPSSAGLLPIPEIARLAKPDEAARHVAIGMLQIGEIGLAESSWQSATQLGKDLWLNWFGFGQFLQRGGRYGEAAIAFTEAAARASPEMVWPLESLTRLELVNGDLPGALQIFESMDETLADRETVRQVAAAYGILGQLDKSLHLFRLALEQNPRDPLLHLEIGDVLMRLGQEDQAKHQYNQGLQIVQDRLQDHPSDTQLELQLALLAAKGGDCTRALPLAATLRRHLQETAIAYRDLTVIFTLCDNSDMAIDTLRAALNHGLAPEMVRSQPEFRELISMAAVERILNDAESTPPSP